MKKNAIIVCALALVAFIIVLTAINFNKSGKILPSENTTNNDTQPKINTEQTQSETIEFKSRLGYVMSYPKDWVVDDSQKNAPAEFINEPSGKAFVSIQTFEDPRLTKESGRALVFNDIKTSFEDDSQYKLDLFELDNKTDNISNSYLAAGSYAEGDKNWRFKEIGVLNDSGTVFTFRGMVLKEYAGTYGPIVDNVLFSFHPAEKTINFTASQALQKVQNMPEVIEYTQLLAEQNKQAELEVEDWDEDWSVHVFEIVQDDTTSHTATFGWYQVNKTTGDIVIN